MEYVRTFRPMYQEFWVPRTCKEKRDYLYNVYPDGKWDGMKCRQLTAVFIKVRKEQDADR